MVGWTIFGMILAFSAFMFYEDVIRKMIIVGLFTVVFLLAAAITRSFGWAVLLGGVASFGLAMKIYINLMNREAEAREREREEIHRQI